MSDSEETLKLTKELRRLAEAETPPFRLLPQDASWEGDVEPRNDAMLRAAELLESLQKNFDEVEPDRNRLGNHLFRLSHDADEIRQELSLAREVIEAATFLQKNYEEGTEPEAFIYRSRLNPLFSALAAFKAQAMTVAQTQPKPLRPLPVSEELLRELPKEDE